MGRLKMRTFIALPLEAPVRRRVVALQQRLAEADSEVKWVEPENLHVTLLFLGEVDAREILDVCKAVRGVTEGMEAFAIEVGTLGCFPNLRRPRTLWAGVEEGREEIIRMHGRLEEALTRLGGYRREAREFTPHITLGRVKSDDVTAPLRALLTGETEWSGGRQTVSEVHVMGSELKADGPAYTVLSREKLRLGGDAVE